ncbi:hypothetical protein [Serratia marcescens]|uniref:hypothetical protein n=1 Tax=Serratia marcescens TaxID=615 RepID=UPI0018687684|nr:hypothetical protein [Serratia marcescens]
MNKASRGRYEPSPPLPYPGSGAPAFEWAFPWNAPRPAIEPPVDLLAESQKQTEEQIAATLRAHHLLEQQPQLIQRDVRYLSLIHI